MVVDVVAEERQRESALVRQERFLPATEGMRPVRDLPEGYSLDAGPDLPEKIVRVEESEVAEAGGTAGYMENFHPADLAGDPSDENIDTLKGMWLKIYGEECPYGFDDIHDREINFESALNRLEGVWEDLYYLELAKIEGEADVKFDRRGLTNEVTKAFLERKGDEEFVKRIWGSCTKVILCEPAEGDLGWKLIIEAKQKQDGRREFMLISQIEFEDSLRDENDRPIRLPKLGNGDRMARVTFIENLHKLRIGGVSMPGVVDV